MNIVFFDTETSGIPRWDLPADDPSQPHIVELAAILCDDQTAGVVGKYTEIVKPDGWTIPEGAAKVHGITTERALALGRPIAEVLDAFDALLVRAQLLVAFNLRFDDKLLRGARRRLGRPDGFGTIPVFCCMRGATPLCKLERTAKMKKAGFDKYKTPNLGEAVKILLGRDHVGAHGAMADALATKDIYFACRDNHEFMAAGSAFKTNEDKASFPASEADVIAKPSIPLPVEDKAPQLVPCKWCAKPTPMTGTKMCDGCWELDHRIRVDMPLAERIIEHYKRDAQPKPKEPPAAAPALVDPKRVDQEKSPQAGSAGLGDLFKLY